MKLLNRVLISGWLLLTLPGLTLADNMYHVYLNLNVPEDLVRYKTGPSTISNGVTNMPCTWEGSPQGSRMDCKVDVISAYTSGQADNGPHNVNIVTTLRNANQPDSTISINVQMPPHCNDGPIGPVSPDGRDCTVPPVLNYSVSYDMKPGQKTPPAPSSGSVTGNAFTDVMNLVDGGVQQATLQCTVNSVAGGVIISTTCAFQ